MERASAGGAWSSMPCGPNGVSGTVYRTGVRIESQRTLIGSSRASGSLPLHGVTAIARRCLPMAGKVRTANRRFAPDEE